MVTTDSPETDSPETGTPEMDMPKSEAPVECVVTVANPQGLHMRTSNEIVRIAAAYAAELSARNLSRTAPEVNLKSILQVMQLQARGGHQIRLIARGADAEAALAALAALIEAPPVAAGALTPENTSL